MFKHAYSLELYLYTLTSCTFDINGRAVNTALDIAVVLICRRHQSEIPEDANRHFDVPVVELG